MSKAPEYDCPSCGVIHEYGKHVSATPADSLRQSLIDLIYPEFAKELKYEDLNEINRYKMNEIMHLIAAHEQALLGRVKTEVIGKDEVFIDIPIVDHIGKTTSIIDGNSYTPYMVARNNLRAEQRNKMNALLPSGGVEGETE